MSPPRIRHAYRRDANEPAIMQVLQLAGAVVVQVKATEPAGFPDLVARRGARFLLVEVKVPGGKLNRAQVEWWGRNQDADAVVVDSPSAAREAFAAWSRGDKLDAWKPGLLARARRQAGFTAAPNVVGGGR